MDEEPKIDGEVLETAGAGESESAGAETPPAPDAQALPAPAAAAPMTPERMLDIALGVAVLTGEAIDRSARNLTERAKEIQQQAPEFISRAEERGRPLRENLLGIYSDETPAARQRSPAQNGDAATGASAAGGAMEISESGDAAASAAPSLGAGLAESLRSLGSSLGLISGGGSTARQSAEDEIRTLESRVRELEQVVASGKTGVAEEPAVAEETPADSATYVPGSGHPEDALADSPYAISETAEEQQSGAAADVPAAEGGASSTAPRSSSRRKASRDNETQGSDTIPPSGEGASAA